MHDYIQVPCAAWNLMPAGSTAGNMQQPGDLSEKPAPSLLVGCISVCVVCVGGGGVILGDQKFLAVLHESSGRLDAVCSARQKFASGTSSCPPGTCMAKLAHQLLLR